MSENAVGAVYVFGAMFGIEPQALVWGILGVSLGAPFAKPTGRIRAMLIFLAASFICGLAGTGISMRWFSNEAIVRNAIAAATGLAFQPLKNKLVDMVPAIAEIILRKAKS